MDPNSAAFPADYDMSDFTNGMKGLTKREFFAGLAMAGILAGLPKDAAYDEVETAKVAVEHADLLVTELTDREEREKG